MKNAASSIDMHNVISTEEMYNIIRKNAQTIIDKPELSSLIPPVLFRGAPGVGKSTIVRQVAKDLGIGFVDVRLAQLERVDVSGLPSVENGTTCWNVPSFWPREGKGIILLDEITSCPPDVQVAAYQIVLERAISNSNYKIPDGWYIVAAGNRVEDRAVAKVMSAALANRFMHSDIEANAEQWVKWAAKNDIHPSVIGFINYLPSHLFEMDGQNVERGWPSPRSWERVSTMIPLYNDNEDILRKVVYGLIGNKVGVEFMEFHRINKSFVNVLKLMLDPTAKIELPARSDEKYAMCAALQYNLWHATDEKDQKARIDGFYRIVNEMTSDFATMTVMGAMQGTKAISAKDACSKLFYSDGYKDFAKKHGEHMRARYAL